MRTSRVFYALFALGMLTGLHGLKACGLDFSLTKFHFNSVNEQGYVSYWDRLGEVQLDEKFKLPIDVHFLSSRQTASSYAGWGWSLPVLETYMVQVDERTFRFWQPNGRYRTFKRDKKDPNILSSGSDWRGEIKGDQVGLWADCGWKFVLDKGKVVSISTPANKTYRYEYENGRAVRIKEEVTGRVLLEAKKDEKEAQKSQLLFGDKIITLELSQKPKIQNINGQNLVGGVETSLAQVTLPDGKTRNYAFAVDDKIRPTLTVETNRLIIWDPATMKVIQDGEWKYDIQGAGNLKDNLPIWRSNAKGQKEFWHENEGKGTETIIALDGAKTVRSWFVGGLVSGKTRKIEKTVNGKTEIVQQNIFDEKGRVLRRSEGAKTTAYKYNEDGTSEETETEGETKLKTIFKDGQGRIARSMDHKHGTERLYEYFNGYYVTKFINAKKEVYCVDVIRAGRLAERSIVGVRTEIYKFIDGRRQVEVIESKLKKTASLEEINRYAKDYLESN